MPTAANADADRHQARTRTTDSHPRNRGQRQLGIGRPNSGRSGRPPSFSVPASADDEWPRYAAVEGQHFRP